jgi:hypothetical protein
MSGGGSPGVSGCGVMSRQAPLTHQVRASAESKCSNRRSTKPPVNSSSRSSRNLAATFHAGTVSATSGI